MKKYKTQIRMITACILIITIMLPVTSEACLSASQNRMFPVGICDKGLVVVEIRMHRTEFNNNDPQSLLLLEGWLGSSFLNVYNKQQQLVTSQLIEKIKMFPETHYDSIINHSFNKGSTIAGNFPGFAEVLPVMLSFCGYQTTCKSARVITDTKACKMFIEINQKKYPVSVLNDTLSIAADYIKKFSGNDPEKKCKLITELGINSIRKFKLRNDILTIVHLGTGQSFGDEADELTPEEEASFNFKAKDKRVFQEGVLHHGTSFDFFIWQTE